MNCPQCGLWLPLANNAPQADNQLEAEINQAMLGGFCSMECREACYKEMQRIVAEAMYPNLHRWNGP